MRVRVSVVHNAMGLWRPHLHLVLAVLVDPVFSLLSLFVAFDPGSHCTDLDLLQRRREVGVKGKRISGVHVSANRMLLQYLEFGARQGLQIPLEFNVRNGGRSLDFLEAIRKPEQMAQPSIHLTS